MDNLELLLTKILDFGGGWKVTEIKIDNVNIVIDLYLEYTELTGIFPRTSDSYKLYDLGKQRIVRHLDMFQYKCFLNFRIPRVKNKEGQIRNINLSFIDERVCFTHLFENKVLEALLMSKNQSKTADFFDCSFDIVHSIMCRGVNRGLERRKLVNLEALSLDEKSYSNGHQYLTILSDPINKRVLDITEGRKMEDAEAILYDYPHFGFANLFGIFD